MLVLLIGWIAPIVAVLLLLLIVAQRPRRFWRPVMARAGEASPIWWVLLSLAALGSWAAIGWFLMRIVEVRRPSGGLGPGWAAIDRAFGFLKTGFTGSPDDQLNMQAAILWGAIAIASGYLAVRLRHTLFSLDIDPQPEAPPRRVIIMGLSDLAPGSDAALARLAAMPIGEAVRADVGRVSWQQNLRVLAHHCARDGFRRRRRFMPWRTEPDPRPHHVIILPSHQTKDLVPQFEALAKACLQAGSARSVKYHPWRTSVDYDDLAALQDQFRAIIRWARAAPDIAAQLDEISIDTTAGFKVLSIAGAAATFASPTEFTYVQTRPPFDVLAFDVQAVYRPSKLGVRWG
jgi:hypothetical protein